MAELVMLGTAWALPSAVQENTYMALVGDSHTVLIDCAGSPYRRLLQASLDPAKLDTMILTHGHPDHIYGVPSLIMSLWLAGRRLPFDIYGCEETCVAVQAMMSLYHPEHWPDMFPVHYHSVPLREDILVLDDAEFRITAAPVRHLLPTMGLRIFSHNSGCVIAYSADTEPAGGVHYLAREADILVHEASGAGPGHSSAAQAGAIAEEAGVAKLVLVHYGAHVTSPEALTAEARVTYNGPIHVARDFDRFTC